MSGDGDPVQVALVRIQGGVDLINERLLHSNKVNDERHEAVREDIKDIRATQHRHSNRIGVLEAAKTLSEGERKGLSLAGKFLWATIGAVPFGTVVAILMRLLGHA